MVRIDFNRLRFLVIDDNAHMRRILRTLLHGFGARDVYEAEDGAAGLEAFTHYMPDIVITDWAMPIFDGLELTQMIRQPRRQFEPLRADHHADRPFREEARDARARRRRHRVHGQADLGEVAVSARAQCGRQPAPVHQDQNLFRSRSAPQRQPELRRSRAPQGRQSRHDPPACPPRQSPGRWLRTTTMNERKSDKAAVMTYADHEIITPPNKLRKAIRTVGANEPPDDPVERAEQALSELAEEFSGWMRAEVERLDRARYGIKTHGFNKASLEALF